MGWGVHLPSPTLPLAYVGTVTITKNSQGDSPCRPMIGSPLTTLKMQNSKWPHKEAQDPPTDRKSGTKAMGSPGK